MKNDEIINWLEDSLGNDVTIITPQFERTEKLEYEFKPTSKKQFLMIVNNAPWDILRGMGFRRWDNMSEIAKENKASQGKGTINIPIINAPGHTYDVDLEHEGPTKGDVNQWVIMIPGEWYDIIPEGFMVTGLYGEKYPFKKGESDDDIRYGCLPYGIVRKLPKPK